MKLVKNKFIISVLLMIGLSILFTTRAFAMDWVSEVDPAHIYEKSPNLYCGQKGNDGEIDTIWPSYYADNIKSGAVSGLNKISTEDMDLKVAYGIWMGETGAALQNTIWDHTSNNKGRQLNGGSQKPKDYKIVHDEIFQNIKDGKLFRNTTNANNLKVLVDQIGKTYTVGPYSIELNINGSASEEAKQLLVNEIRNGSIANHDFAEYNGIVGINGTNIKLVDKNGNAIAQNFPSFGQEFYVRFTPNNDGAIISTGDFAFKVTYITGFSGGDVTRFSESSLRGDVVVTGTTKMEKYDGSGAKWDSYPSKADPYSEITIEGTQNISLTYKGTFSSIYTESREYSKTENYTIKFYRTAYYDEDGDFSYLGYIHADADSINRIPLSLTWTETNQTFTEVKTIQDTINVPTDVEEQVEATTDIDLVPGDGEPTFQNSDAVLPGAPIDMQIGGTVWIEVGNVKEDNIDGQLKTGDRPFAGIQVQLYESDGTLVATTTTDANGKYRFFGQKGNGVALINALKKYYVEFTYNGQVYQSTYYKNNLSGGFSNAKDVGRSEYNIKFRDIYSDSSNYNANGWHKAFAMEQKIEKDNGDYIAYNGGALKYKDVYDKFMEYAKMNNTHSVDSDKAIKPTTNDYKEVWANKYSKSYSDVLNGNNVKISNKTFTQWLTDLGVSNTEITSIKQFISDTFIKSTTKQKDSNKKDILYPKYDKFIIQDLYKGNNYNNQKYSSTVTFLNNVYNLYSKSYDMARYVDYGVCLRELNDLALQKDVYEATVIVNGKKEHYIYSKKDLTNDGTWEVKTRASDVLFNGSEVYNREVRKSEYLYDGSDAGTTDNKNLQVYVTYRIAVKNQGQVNTTINEIVDYYDADAYNFDGTLNGNTYAIKEHSYSPTESKKAGQNGSKYVNSFVGSDARGSKLSDITVKTKGIPNESRNQEKVGDYTALYLTGIKSESGDNILVPGELAYAYVTFKVKTDDTTGKVKLDQDLTSGSLTVGKRNIAEINGYSTYYVKDTKIPNILDNNNKPQNTIISNDTTPAGLIDSDSNPGNLKGRDLNDKGDIITDKDNEVVDRQEDDTDKSPNIKIIIDESDNDIRRFNGYVYEDERVERSENAVIGNGKYDDNESKINGVTLELVELVQNVDEEGTFLGTYSGEKVWESYTYSSLTDLNNAIKDNSRYASGQGYSRVIITGPKGTILEVKEDDIGQGNGSYSFKSMPAGDFYIRFKYGDTRETVLTNTDNEVNKLIGEAGLNAKSYNGQDYKSTVYQAGIDQNNSSYNGINGFTNYEDQNYTKADNSGVIVAEPKDRMYYYNKERSKAVAGASDAKDVYYYRQKEMNYSKGVNGVLLNNRAEVLASFEKLATYKDYNRNEAGEIIYEDGNPSINTDNRKTAQNNMINELINNTQMVAQTGIINAQVELHGQEDKDKDSQTRYETRIQYIIDDIDLGLSERPKAGLKLNKEVENVRIDLRNYVIDTSKSVRNLYFSEHQQHQVEYENGLNKIRQIILNNNNDISTKPELIQAYIDDELLQIATIQAKYKITVENIGEIDYKDKKFYYTGIEDNADANISKTKAVQVVDYLSNSIKYDPASQESQWQVRTASELVNSATIDQNGKLLGIDSTKIEGDYVNREYIENLLTYDVLLTTNALDGELVPFKNGTGNSSKEATLIASTKATSNNGVNNLVYNNLAEIIATSNDMGRRNVYSIAGNEEMQNQSLGDNAARGAKSGEDRVNPKEIDADSAQKIVIMPPTGKNENYTIYMVGIMIVMISIMGIVFIIKKKAKNK